MAEGVQFDSLSLVEIPSLFIGLVATETDPSQKYIIKIDNDDDDVTLRFKSQTLKTAFKSPIKLL